MTAGATAAPSFPTIPGCRLLAIAGQGGMGTVYRAEQAAPRRLVAVKVLSQAAASPEHLASFHREAETIARLEHPNILPVYGFGEAQGRPYLVLRYLGGGSLAVLIRHGPIEIARAVGWARAVAGALDFAHAHGLVHRDVKPSNMLLDEAGNVYLSDFGIASALAAATEAAHTGGQVGSAAYMSPEQGSGLAADRRSDIYSLAVSLFEMLTGQPPYTADTALGVIVRHINDPIPSARALNPAISPALDALLQRGMAKSPAARPQTAAEFARLLDQALAAPNAPAVAAAPLPTTLLDLHPPAAAAAPAPRRLLWLGIGLAALCLLAAIGLGGGGALLAFLNAPRPTLPAATLTPSLAATPSLPPTPAGQLLAVDFAEGLSGFRISQLDDTGGIVYAGGALRFRVLQNGVEWFSTSGQVHTQDVKIDVEARQTAGPAGTEFGAICRWQNASNFTAFAVSAGGQYKIWQKINGASLRLNDWTDAPSLAGAGLGAHHFSITCAGPQLSLTVDNVPLGQTEDPGPVAGDVALFAGLREDGQMTVDFSKITVTQP